MIRRKVIGYDEVLERMKAGEVITFYKFSYVHYMGNDATLRYDTFIKFWNSKTIKRGAKDINSNQTYILA